MLHDLPILTFDDVAGLGLEVDLYCPGCHRSVTIDLGDERLRGRRFAGARFRCTEVRKLWSASPERVCNCLAYVYISPPPDRRIAPGQAIPHASLNCPRCVPYWEIRQAPRDEPPWSAVWNRRGDGYRCPACRVALRALWSGGRGVPYSEGFRDRIDHVR